MACKLRIRTIVLGLLVAQSTSIVLLMRYSKTRPIEGGPPYAATAAVLMAELLKLPVCLGMAAWTLGGIGPLQSLLMVELFGAGKLDTFKCAVPAVAYTLQGNLLFVALANLEAPTYQVSYQCKTLFTALFSWMILNRELKRSQWLALFLLFAGTVLVSDPWHTGAKAGGGPKRADVNPIVGLSAVLTAAVLSAGSSVYFEMMLKKKPSSAAAAAVSLWLRNVQLGIFATPLAAAAMLLNDGEFVAMYGLLQGFDSLVWLIVLLNGLGGLLVAATMKYADNIAKCFAASLAIVSGTILSVPVFGFSLSATFGLGALCTTVASTLYSLAPNMQLLGGSTYSPAPSEQQAPLLRSGIQLKQRPSHESPEDDDEAV